MGPATPIVLQIERTSPRTLRLTGEVDFSNAGALSSVLDSLVLSPGDITLDLEGVVFMDSTGIGILMGTAKSLGIRGTLRLISPGPLVHNVLRLIRAESLPNLEILSGENA